MLKPAREFMRAGAQWSCTHAMAKRNSPKSESQDPSTPERRRRSATTGANGAAQTAARAPRRRKADVTAAAPASDETSLTQAEHEFDASSLEPSEAPAVPYEQIAVRAYHLYLERGGRAGGEF
jgi:hypothetical protein